MSSHALVHRVWLALAIILVIANGIVGYNLYVTYQCSLTGRKICLTPLLFILSILSPAVRWVYDTLFYATPAIYRNLIGNILFLLVLNAIILAVYIGLVKVIRLIADTSSEND